MVKGEKEMQSPWFGGILMIVMIVGLVAWVWWAMKAKKDDE
jgi:hypothetical protein